MGQGTYEEYYIYRNAGSWKKYRRSGSRKAAWVRGFLYKTAGSVWKQENRLLREIIAEEGLDGFLRIENQVNRDVEAEHAVISPGGSVVYCEEAMKHYKEIGTIVYLHASFEVINSRLKNAKNFGTGRR